MDNANDYDRLDDILIPALAFDHPMDVVDDPDLTLAEKKALLASWASDAQALENQPALRRSDPRRSPVPIDDILAALRHLDFFPDVGRQAAREARRRSVETSRATRS